MMFSRHTNADPATNVSALLGALQEPLGRKVTLFVSAPHMDTITGASQRDGTALPLIAAVAKHEVAGHDMETVFDGRFLTAADLAEIDLLVRTAVASKRAWFARERAPFTSSLSPEDAVTTLLSAMQGQVSPLTLETQDAFMKLLRPQ
jgi:hypothetical protein